MRVEGVGLEDHGETPFRRSKDRGIDVIDLDASGGGILEAGDQPQERGLAATRRANEDDKLAIPDLEIEWRYDLHVTKALGNGFQSYLTHCPCSYLTAPKVRPRTSCFWLNQPRIRIGAMASVLAALSLA